MPLTVPSYSGRKVRIAAYGRDPLPQQLPVKMLLRDMFGKTYELEVAARQFRVAASQFFRPGKGLPFPNVGFGIPKTRCIVVLDRRTKRIHQAIVLFDRLVLHTRMSSRSLSCRRRPCGRGTSIYKAIRKIRSIICLILP
jgi:hypothetical protein